MIGAPNSLNLNCKVRVMKEAPGPWVSEEIADIFRNYNIDILVQNREPGGLGIMMSFSKAVTKSG